MQTTKSISHVIGISAYYHDSAAALISNGELKKAASQERFSRRKNDAEFPLDAIKFCLSDINLSDVSAIAYYEKPFLKFERLIETQMAFAPRGFTQFRHAAATWATEKLFLKSRIKKQLAQALDMTVKELPPLYFTQHHQAHAASAYYCSPFERAAILCIDGVGEWATTSAWLGEANQLKPLWQINFPHSLGLLYSAFTQYCGFEVNSGEYKLMGLAPYGSPRFVDLIRDNLIDIKPDGTFRLNMEYFAYCTGVEMINSKFEDLFGHLARQPEAAIDQVYMDVAASIQKVTEEVVIKLAMTLKQETGCDSLCLAGGVALNCVVNGKLRRTEIFKDIWVQPAAGDAGGALGAAALVWENLNPGTSTHSANTMQNCQLGPSYSDDEILSALNASQLVAEKLEWPELYSLVAKQLSKEAVIAWFQGHSEFGPRALGSRSILADARSKTMQKTLNLKIKNRESFRPFAPIVLIDKAAEYFDSPGASPHMSFVDQVADRQILTSKHLKQGIERVNDIRSTIPAVTHIDHTARIQTVDSVQNEKLHMLLSEFYRRTGCPVLINTSFNVKDEPIVETPEDAIRCFLTTGIDLLVIGQFVVRKV